MANLEQQRHYQATEAETHRNNLVLEGLKAGELQVNQQNASTNARNAATREGELALAQKEGASRIKLNKANTKQAKAQTKAIKAGTKKTKAETKLVKSNVKNVKADTAKKKRETKHISVVEAQEQQKILNQKEANQIQKEKNLISKAYNEAMIAISKAHTVNEKEKIHNDFLAKCFDNPGLLAYTGLVDSSSTGKKMRKDVKSAISTASSAIANSGGNALEGITAVQKLQKSGKITKTEATAIANMVKLAYGIGGPLVGLLTDSAVIKGVANASKSKKTKSKSTSTKSKSKSKKKKGKGGSF